MAPGISTLTYLLTYSTLDSDIYHTIPSTANQQQQKKRVLKQQATHTGQFIKMLLLLLNKALKALAGSSDSPLSFC